MGVVEEGGQVGVGREEADTLRSSSFVLLILVLMLLERKTISDVSDFFLL